MAEGQKLRDKPLKRPESVLVVVYTLEAELLLLQRADDADFWQSVTGSMEAGEEPAETAARELYEETGLKDLPLLDCQYSAMFEIRPQWRCRYEPGTTHNREHVFLAELPQAVPVLLQPDEHLDYRWLKLPEALQQLWSATNREAVKQFVEPRLK